MTVGLSFVGFQPSATAVALKTWIGQKGKLDRVLLLATARVRREGQAERLEALIKELGCQVEILVIGDTLDRGQSPPSAPEVVRQVLADLGSNSRVVFCGDPGPKFLVVSVAQILPPGSTFLHADTEHLHCGTVTDREERWECYDLESLGMENLLALYGLEGEADSGLVSTQLQDCLRRHKIVLPSHVQQGFRFQGLDVPPLQLAYERGGWFFGLCLVNDLAQVRAVERMSHSLRGLLPVLAIAAENPRLRTQIRAARFQAISPTSGPALLDWVTGRVRPPGYELIPDAVEPSRPLRPCQGRGGGGPPLVVWMGTDPSATLVSLCTHRPGRAWVLYDASTPVAIEMARRLRECCRRLPAGEIIFWASDLLGRGIVSSLREQLGRTRPPVKADISPGRKAQGITLARLPGVQLWSLHTRKGKAVPLAGGPQPLPLRGPDLGTQARMSGGSLSRQGDDACRWNSGFRDFLLLLGQCLATLVNERKGNVFLDPLSDVRGRRGQIKVSGKQIEVAYDGQTRRHELNPRGGYWFERVVAACFVKAGADEVRVGVRWAWPPESLPRTKHRKAAFRAEVDVVARFGPRFFVASCKVGRQPRLTAAAREIEAVASRLVGRLVVPLVIRPWIDQARVEERRRIRQGAAFLDLSALCNPTQLRQTLHELWAARGTLGE